MSAMAPVFIAPVAFVVVVAVVLIPIAIRSERRRRQRFENWAAAHGWTYALRPRADWAARMPGHSRRSVGIALTGGLGGRWVTVADYSYQTSSSSGDGSSSTTTHHFIAVVVFLDRPHPRTAVVDRGPLSKLGRSLFGDKPTATADPLFDARFRITADDPDYARWLIGPPLIAAHLTGTIPTWSVAGNELLAFQHGHLRNPESVPDLAAPLLRVADLLGRA